MTAGFAVGDRRIGPGAPALLIAEIGVNHDGSPEAAATLVREAVRAGADCVKFQTFAAERVATAGAPKADYQLRTTSAAESQIEMLRRLELSLDAHAGLLALCRSLGVVFMSTPYNPEDVDLLESIGCPFYKLASIHAAEPAFVHRVARTGKPVVLSTGMCTGEEVEEAVRALRAAGNARFVLLQCTTDYPSREEEANLRAMVAMGRRFGVPVGYSDHTPGSLCTLGAIALGACIIEKHFTLDRTLPGPDHAASADPVTFAALARDVRRLEAALGDGVKRPTARESLNRPNMRRSVALARDVAAGSPLHAEDLGLRRPEGGIAPRDLESVIGRRARRGLAAGTLLTWDLLEPPDDAGAR